MCPLHIEEKNGGGDKKGEGQERKLCTYRPLHGIRHRKIQSSQCTCRGQKVNSIPLNCVLTREFLIKTKLRAVMVADFYHRGGNGPTTAGGAVL